MKAKKKLQALSTQEMKGVQGAWDLSYSLIAYSGPVAYSTTSSGELVSMGFTRVAPPPPPPPGGTWGYWY